MTTRHNVGPAGIADPQDGKTGKPTGLASLSRVGGRDPIMAEKQARVMEDGDIVKYSLGLDVPVVGLVRDRGTYEDTREMSMICGLLFGLNTKPSVADVEADGGAGCEPDDAASGPPSIKSPRLPVSE